jgi:DNA-binding MarR family transcriptional regulator
LGLGMGGALGEGMDAVMFEVKGAHLAAQRVGRAMLRGSGLTPARFDLMHSLGQRGMKQSDLWRRLEVVRSVVCEMVRALVGLGWVERSRDPRDGRTWVVRLTGRGREVFEDVYMRWVESGDATVRMDQALACGEPRIDALEERTTFVEACRALMMAFLPRPPFAGPDLYPWDPQDYCFWFAEVGTEPLPGDIPFASA